jgi:hypothetical protein
VSPAEQIRAALELAQRADGRITYGLSELLTEALAALDALEAEHHEAKLRGARRNAELADRLEALEAENAELKQSAQALYEQVEMDESVGICLSDRVAALNLGAALHKGEKP